MANTASAIVDRVLPDVPVRQYVLTMPYELRKLAAFKAQVLTAIGRIAVDAIFARYRAHAKLHGIENGQCGAVNFVQRFGSLNLHVHFHIALLDGVFIRDPDAGVVFHPAAAPTREELDAIVRRVQRRATAWLRRHGHLDERALDERSNELPEQTALDACAVIAMGRGQVATLPNADAPEDDHTEAAPGKPAVAVEHDGFNLHAGVRIERGDDVGRERLVRYGARPPLSLERLRRLPGGRVAYRLKYVSRGRGKHRIMTALEFMARLAALIAPPRYPLVRYGGVLAPHSKWRGEIVPSPRERRDACDVVRQDKPAAAHDASRSEPNAAAAHATKPHSPQQSDAARERLRHDPAITIAAAPHPHAPSGDVLMLAPNLVSVQHWDRLLGGLLYATSPRVDWASLLRRSFSVDVLECPKCHGRLRVVAVITEREPVRRILAHLGMATDAPPLARARDPTDDQLHVDPSDQLELPQLA
jgi:hypothetical protein